MTVGVAGVRPSAGVTIAEINLKLIWDVISAIRIGRTGQAFVLDRSGELVAHPDISLVLRGKDNPAAAPLRALQAAAIASGDRLVGGDDVAGRAVSAAAKQIAGPDWMAIVAQPIAEAYQPIRAALWRTAFLLLAGVAFAAALAYWLARRMTGPIKALEDGVRHIGAGEFDYRMRCARATSWNVWPNASTIWRANWRCRRTGPNRSTASSDSCRRKSRSLWRARATNGCSALAALSCGDFL